MKIFFFWDRQITTFEHFILEFLLIIVFVRTFPGVNVLWEGESVTEMPLQFS